MPAVCRVGTAACVVSWRHDGARGAGADVDQIVTKAVIPAAGLGTRFLPATKATPKEMLPVVDTPAIQLVVEEAVAAGLDDVLMVTGRNKRPLEDHFDRAAELEATLQAKGELPTGLLFVDPGATDLHTALNTCADPLNTLAASQLCPGRPTLDKINAALR